MMASSRVTHSENITSTNNMTAATPKGRVRKWQVFVGKNKFGCNGRCICAKDYQGFFLCLGLVVITGGLFFALDCPYLTEKVSPAIPVVGGILWLSIIGALFQTSLIDPGIIPRATLPEALETDRLYQLEHTNQDGNNSSYQAPRFKEIVIKGRSFKLNYCTTCQMYRPPRASHCSQCNNCVARFDHHCPMVGNCIGERNYRYFYTFITLTAIMCCYIIGCNVTVIVLKAKDDDIGEAFKTSVGSIIEGIICLSSLATVGGLACYHSYLVATATTTNEDIKGTFNPKKFKNSINPFSRGNCFSNCCYTLFAPRLPSLLDRLSLVDPTEEEVVQQQTREQERQAGWDKSRSPYPLQHV